MPELTTFTSFDIPGDPDMIENDVTGEVYVRKDLFVRDMMQQIQDSGDPKEQIQKDIEHTLKVPTPLDVIIGTYTDAEIEEYIDGFRAKIEDLTAEKRQFELALSLAQRYGLTDELEKRIAAIQATGLVFTGFDEQGNEVWVSKTTDR